MNHYLSALGTQTDNATRMRLYSNILTTFNPAIIIECCAANDVFHDYAARMFIIFCIEYVEYDVMLDLYNVFYVAPFAPQQILLLTINEAKHILLNQMKRHNFSALSTTIRCLELRQPHRINIHPITLLTLPEILCTVAYECDDVIVLSYLMDNHNTANMYGSTIINTVRNFVLNEIKITYHHPNICKWVMSKFELSPTRKLSYIIGTNNYDTILELVPYDPNSNKIPYEDGRKARRRVDRSYYGIVSSRPLDTLPSITYSSDNIEVLDRLFNRGLNINIHDVLDTKNENYNILLRWAIENNYLYQYDYDPKLFVTSKMSEANVLRVFVKLLRSCRYRKQDWRDELSKYPVFSPLLQRQSIVDRCTQEMINKINNADEALWMLDPYMLGLLNDRPINYLEKFSLIDMNKYAYNTSVITQMYRYKKRLPHNYIKRCAKHGFLSTITTLVRLGYVLTVDDKVNMRLSKFAHVSSSVLAV